MTHTQKKEIKESLIPTDKILKYNDKELRAIASRQIKSLKKRGILSRNFSVYIYEINRVILHEKGEI